MTIQAGLKTAAILFFKPLCGFYRFLSLSFFNNSFAGWIRIFTAFLI